jgi:hypothetical protein
MQIRIKESGAVMYESEFRAYTKANGGPSWDITTTEVLTALGADVVFEGPEATGGDHYQYSQADGVEQIDGKWYTKHILGPVFTDTPATEEAPAKTAAEHEAAYKAAKDAEQAKSVRQSRDDKLKETDWVVIKNLEANANIPNVWEVYRQALRDVPTQEGFPWTIVWPTQPE